MSSVFLRSTNGQAGGWRGEATGTYQAKRGKTQQTRNPAAESGRWPSTCPILTQSCLTTSQSPDSGDSKVNVLRISRLFSRAGKERTKVETPQKIRSSGSLGESAQRIFLGLALVIMI